MSQHFVITGSSRGIGLEMTRQLLLSGKQVTALARDPEGSDGLRKLRESSQLRVFKVDVTSDDSVGRFQEEFGDVPVDVLVNNAGVFLEYSPTLETLSFEKIRQSFETNTIAPMRMIRALLPNLSKARLPKIANITSLMGSIDDNESGRAYGYRMSKAALNMLTRNLAMDYRKIISLAIHPGWVKTDMGGADAPTPVAESVQGIINVIERAGPGDSGDFIGFDGERYPW